MKNKRQYLPGKIQKQPRDLGVLGKIILALILIPLAGCGILTDKEQVEVREPALEKLAKDRYPDFLTPLTYQGF